MSKKYYWNWTTDTRMDEDLPEFLEVSKKKNNNWWKSLRSTNMYRTHIDAFKDFANHFFATGEITKVSNTATVKTCPAIGNGLLDKVILVKLPCDVFISIREDGNSYWNIKDPDRVNIECHPVQQFYTETHNPFLNKINFKFVLPITFSSNKDTYMFLQPQYHQQKYPFEVVNGSVNANRIKIAINTLIEVPKEQTEIFLKAGTILAYMWFDNNKIELEKDEKLTPFIKPSFYGVQHL